jgi:hypothetical protein
VEKRPDNSFELTQSGLISKVVRYTGLQESNKNYIPASSTPLGSDLEGERWDDATGGSEYAAAVGMLMYLANNTRPEISFAVNQCARFSHCPKVSPAKAVKTIVRYLQGTRYKGLIFSPTGELVVDCYVDADWAGLWQVETDQDPTCVKSRTGYVLELSGCPLSWTSKLQSEIALSTMESEYIALSTAMRELKPLRKVVAEIASIFDKNASPSCRTFSKVFEDNNATLPLAKVPRTTLRNRHFAVKYHFFREHAARGDIEILKIASLEQKAVIFTKGLPRELFETIRKLLCGW